MPLLTSYGETRWILKHLISESRRSRNLGGALSDVSGVTVRGTGKDYETKPKPSVEFGTNPDDPHKDDEELQIHKAVAGAQAHFHQKFGEAPPFDQLVTRVIKE